MIDLIGNLGIQTPWALAALLTLPVIWWLLRFIPPRPQQVKFPPTRILLELGRNEETPDKMPWWLLLLRLLMAAALITGVAHLLLTSGSLVERGTKNILLIVDDGWASAKTWTQRTDFVTALLDDAQRRNVTVSLAFTTPRMTPQSIEPQAASTTAEKLLATRPRSLAPARSALLSRLTIAGNASPDQIVWISDGLNDSDARKFAEGLAKKFPEASRLAVIGDPKDLPAAISSARLTGADIKADIVGSGDLPQKVTVQARAADGRTLAEAKTDLKRSATVTITLPIELRNDIQSLVLASQDNAASRFLLDDRWRRKTVMSLSGAPSEDQQPLLSPLHYVSRAIEPFAELSVATSAADIQPALDSGLSMLILADIGILSDDVHDRIERWVSSGGLLVRFAGPRMAAAVDDLVPVQLREGGRQLGSALSWETPQQLQSFRSQTPFENIAVDPTVQINRQVLAEPDANLPEQTWASLADGTPLVTSARHGKGIIVLFHVTASPEWSNLPLSGTFAAMLRQLVDIAPTAGASNTPDSAAAAQTDQYVPKLMLSGTGDLTLPEPDAPFIPSPEFDKTRAGATAIPGLYSRSGFERALNVEPSVTELMPISDIEGGFVRTSLEPPNVRHLSEWFFGIAFLLFLLDGVASLWIGGAIVRNAKAVSLALVLLLIEPRPATEALADSIEKDLQAALQTRLAYVRTNDPEVDRISEEGLKGLSLVISDRTAARLGEVAAIDVEKDELVLYPILYWPVVADAEQPTAAGLAKIDAYMKNGGTIFFDLRDDGFDSGSLLGEPNGSSDALQRITSKLNIPPLEPVAEQHVLTRSFYLMADFPGRYASGKLWVQAGGSGSASDPGTADGVSPIIIGSNDYAAAWAMDESYSPLYAVSGGDDRQREFAFRTGINIVMYALTGNYKADQVHIPALLERLGQ